MVYRIPVQQSSIGYCFVTGPGGRWFESGLPWAAGQLGPSVPDQPATLRELEYLGVCFVTQTEALDLTVPTSLAMPEVQILSPRPKKSELLPISLLEFPFNAMAHFAFDRPNWSTCPCAGGVDPRCPDCQSSAFDTQNHRRGRNAGPPGSGS
jgi:hypothetical protein